MHCQVNFSLLLLRIIQVREELPSGPSMTLPSLTMSMHKNGTLDYAYTSLPTVMAEIYTAGWQKRDEKAKLGFENTDY